MKLANKVYTLIRKGSKGSISGYKFYQSLSQFVNTILGRVNLEEIINTLIGNLTPQSDDDSEDDSKDTSKDSELPFDINKIISMDDGIGYGIVCSFIYSSFTLAFLFTM